MSEDIYSYIEENFNIKITDYQFKRDYIKEPLKKINKKWEIPYYKDWYYLYITLNLSYNELEQILNVNKGMYAIWNKAFNIKKDSKMMFEKTKQTSLKKYGVSNPAQYFENKEKHSIIMKSKAVQDKIKQTCLEKYGVEHVSQYKEFEIKKQNTNLKKYGVKHISQLNSIIDKMEQTCLKKYGVKHVLQNDNIMKKKAKTILDKYGYQCFINHEYTNREKALQTNLEKYGTKWYSQLPEWKEKVKKTCLEKYGVPNYSQTKEYIERIYITKSKNKSFTISKEEDKIYDILCQKYKEVKRQYKSDSYSFNCDFYIPEIDTYIEYQGNWTHGNEPYVGTDKQKEKVKLWESKSAELNCQGKRKKMYKDAIYIWTIRDPLKREIAKKNNLNWLEFFSIKEFMNWFRNQY